MKVKVRRVLNTFVFFLICLTAFCCHDEVQDTVVQEVFFQVSYTNSAWGEQNKGFIIDRNGRIRTYDNPSGWHETGGRSDLTAGQMSENLAKTVLHSQTISADQLKKYSQKIAVIKENDFTPPLSAGADRGSTRYFAFNFDPESKTYHAVFLAEEGDKETYNKDEAAMEIVSWLRTVQSSLAD